MLELHVHVCFVAVAALLPQCVREMKGKVEDSTMVPEAILTDHNARTTPVIGHTACHQTLPSQTLL